jgi:hypothetical protein
VNLDMPGLAAAMNAIAGSAAGWEMAVRLGQSLEITDALWELAPVVVAAGERVDERPAVQAADLSPAARGLDSSDRARLQALGDRFIATLDAAVAEQRIDEEALRSLTPTEVMADPFGTIGALLDLPTYLQQALPAAAGLASLSSREMLYLVAYLRQAAVSPRTPLLLRALLVTAVGTVEPLVTRLVRLLMNRAAPQAYSSLADPRLDQQARDACFGPPARWREALEALGVNVIGDLVDWTALGRLWEDRNVIIHRGSVVDARHSTVTGADPGTVLLPSPEDVRSAIDQIGAARYALAAAVWAHLEPGVGGMIAEGAGVPVGESLRAGRWRQAEGLAKVQAAFATDPEVAATAAVNGWLAIEMGHGPEAIREEVVRWDVNGLPLGFQMARHLLLREDEEGMAMMRQLIADGTLTQADLAVMPLFARLHEDGQLNDLVSRL